MGSNPIFVKTILNSECSAVGSVSVLGIEGHGFKSLHSDIALFKYGNLTNIFESIFNNE